MVEEKSRQIVEGEGGKAASEGEGANRLSVEGEGQIGC